MADPPAAPAAAPADAAAAAAAADLESEEIWGDQADQLDEEIVKVGDLRLCDHGWVAARLVARSFRACLAKCNMPISNGNSFLSLPPSLPVRPQDLKTRIAAPASRPECLIDPAAVYRRQR